MPVPTHKEEILIVVSPIYVQIEVVARINQEIKSQTYQIARSHIFVHDLDSHIVSNILYIDVESLVPLGGLASTIEGTSSELLLPR